VAGLCSFGYGRMTPKRKACAGVCGVCQTGVTVGLQTRAAPSGGSVPHESTAPPHTNQLCLASVASVPHSASHTSEWHHLTQRCPHISKHKARKKHQTVKQCNTVNRLSTVQHCQRLNTVNGAALSTAQHCHSASCRTQLEELARLVKVESLAVKRVPVRVAVGCAHCHLPLLVAHGAVPLGVAHAPAKQLGQWQCGSAASVAL
jgi:hypothetical protein